MTYTCLSCTVHSCVSHLGCPGAVDPMRSSGVRGTVWTSEDQSELKKLSHRLTPFIPRGQVHSDHTDWPPVVMRLTPTRSMLTPIAQAHSYVMRDLRRSKSSISVLRKFLIREMVEICLSNSKCFQSIHEPSHFPLQH